MGYKFNNYYEMLCDGANKHPNKTLIFEDNSKLSYGEFKICVDKIAAFLQSHGVKFGDNVAMIVTNSSQFMMTYLAITSIGAVGVAINTMLKSDEFEFILKDCKAVMLFASTQKAEQITPFIKKNPLLVVWIGEKECYDGQNIAFEALLDFKIPKQNCPMPALDDIATIIYTSGTTGNPKGAMLSYKNVFSNLSGASEVLNITHKDRFIAYLPMFHSFTLTIMVLLPIYACASVVVMHSVFPFSSVLKQTLLRRVTVFLGIPSIFTAITRSKIPWYFKWFNSIRLFICGSSALAAQTIDDFKKIFPRATLLEGYGLSECSPVVSVNRPSLCKPLSVGLALPGYEVKIVGEDMMELDVGKVGEIIIKGECVMQRYLNHPSSTDQTIINGWLKTGDLGRVDSDGYIYIVERLKDIIISKGQNIYPRQIEEILYKFPQIQAAAVVGIKDSAQDEIVVAFVQLHENQSLNEKEIREFLRQKLANFKIPKHIYFTKTLPLNATGKVLKRILKENISEYMQ